MLCVSNMRPETVAAQAEGPAEQPTGGTVPGIHPATTFERGADLGYPAGRAYSRDDNPTYDGAEATLNALEGGQGCRLFASGHAAAAAVLRTLAPDDHVIAPAVMYWGLRRWMARPGAPTVEFLPALTPQAVDAALRPGRTKLVWVETPANPTWQVTDIAAVAAAAHAGGARVVVDSTVATPVLTRPFENGADLVLHSASKYLNGHGDVIAGALVTARDDQTWRDICEIRRGDGAVLGPFEAWLMLRGMRTLFLRVAASCRGAKAIAEHFAAHPRIVEVLYPGLATHPGHAIAARQMTGGFGGMLSLRVAGGEASAIAVAAGVTLFKRATSLGGVESLIEHRASIEGEGTVAPRDMLRLSVGIEHPDDPVADLEDALRV